MPPSCGVLELNLLAPKVGGRAPCGENYTQDCRPLLCCCTAAAPPAADHYAAKLAGLILEDPVAALLSDSAYFFILLDIHNGVRLQGFEKSRVH